ncbi:MAG: hypothetical protein ISN29_08555, partial [Gammaproteobacteria bacterium AqS3]|nr:hypothetical protein [Gammaproteobacteria bacterium AqS3]
MSSRASPPLTTVRLRRALSLSALSGALLLLGAAFSAPVQGQGGGAGRQLVLTSDMLAAVEGESPSYSVKLGSAPSGDVTVRITSSTDPSSVRAPAGSLTFTTANWSTAQSLAVSAIEDADTDDETVTLVMLASGGGYGGVSKTLTLKVTDNDSYGVHISKSAISLTEGGSASSFSARITREPSNKVTVSVRNPDTGAVLSDTDTSNTGQQSTMTFTSANWSTLQSVEVSPVDDIDGLDENVEISVTATGGGYSGQSARVSVSVTDDDSYALVLVPAASLSVTEGGNARFTVALDTQPTGAVTVAVETADGSDLTASPTSLSFSTGNWQTGQTVTLTAGDDADVNGETETLTLTGSGFEFQGVVGRLSVSISDDDYPAPVFTPAKDSTITINEGGSGSFNVRLDQAPSLAAGFSMSFTQPAAGTGVTLDTDAAAAGNQTALAFNAGNWQRGLDVAVSAARDNDPDDETATVSATWTGQTSAQSVMTISVDDNGIPVQLVGLPGPLVTINEGDTLTVSTIRLASAPSDAVTLTFASSDTGSVTVDTDPSTSGNQATLSFTTTNWSTPQSIVLAAVPDSSEFADATETVSITASAASGGYNGLMGSFRVLSRDAGLVGLKLSARALGIAEGTTGSFTVELEAAPSDDIRVRISRAGSITTSATPDDLSFTADNWDTAQTVYVVAGSDADAEDDTATISLVASSGSVTSPARTVAVSVDDDERGRPSFTQSRTVLKEGASDTIQLRIYPRTPRAGGALERFTVSNVQGDLRWSTVNGTSSHSGTAGKSDFTHGSQNPGHYDFTITALADSDSDNDDAGLDIRVVGPHPDGAAGGTVTSDFRVRFKVVDDDGDAELVVSSERVELVEGAESTQSVQLGSAPTQSPVVVTLASSDTAVATAAFSDGSASKSLTATGSGATPQFKISAVDDAGYSTQPRTATVTLTASSTVNNAERYIDVEKEIAVVVGENPARVTGAGLSAVADVVGTEGGAAVARTLSLSAQPRSDVTVSLLPASAGSGVSFASDQAGTTPLTSLTFTGGADGNWETAQTFYTVFGEDADAEDDLDRITLVATGSGYGGVTGSFSVRTRDDEATPIGFVVSGTPSAAEGSAAGFTVKLQSRPSANVTVALRTGADIASVTPTSLTFTRANWDTAQDVSAVTVEDDDAVADIGSVSLSASGGGYDGQSAEVEVDITEGDTASLTLSASALSIDEGDSDSFTVRLAAAPTGDVTVTPSAGAGLHSVAPGRLTFTPASWGTAQRVHVIPALDDDGSNSTATVSLSASGGGFGSATGSVSVSITDTQQAAPASTVTYSPTGSTTILEGHSGATKLNIYLSQRPTQSLLKFTVTSSEVGENKAPGSGSLQFEAVTGVSSPQKIKGSAEVQVSSSTWTSATSPFFVINVYSESDDDRVDGGGQIQVDIEAGSSAADLSAFPGGSFAVPFTVVEDDINGFLATHEPVALDEDGAAVQLGLRPATNPGAHVAFTVTSSDPDVFTVTPNLVNFANTNTYGTPWHVNQNLTITPVDDSSFTEAVKKAEIRITALPGNDNMFNYTHGFVETIAVEVRDDDRDPGLSVIADVAGTEGAAPLPSRVALTREPAAGVTVTVALTSDNPDVSFASDAAGAAAITQLSFTSANWNTPQTFYNVLGDDADVGDDTATVTLVARGGTQSWGARSYAVAIADTDFPGTLALSGAAELGVDRNLSLVLTRRPSADVRVGPISFIGIERPSVTPLTFTPNNWNVPQSVLVRGRVDLGERDPQGSITWSVTGGGYSLAGHRTEFTVVNSIAGGIEVAEPVLSAVEGAGATYSVRLTHRPRAAVTVSAVSGDAGTVSTPADLSFTPADWDVAKKLTVRALEDADTRNESPTITLTASG